jgi:hypothetical protein
MQPAAGSSTPPRRVAPAVAFLAAVLSWALVVPYVVHLSG